MLIALLENDNVDCLDKYLKKITLIALLKNALLRK